MAPMMSHKMTTAVVILIVTPTTTSTAIGTDGGRRRPRVDGWRMDAGLVPKYCSNRAVPPLSRLDFHAVREKRRAAWVRAMRPTRAMAASSAVIGGCQGWVAGIATWAVRYAWMVGRS